MKNTDNGEEKNKNKHLFGLAWQKLCFQIEYLD